LVLLSLWARGQKGFRYSSHKQLNPLTRISEFHWFTRYTHYKRAPL
jgi:hypothetical protein